MNNDTVTRDERTVAIENASYRLAYYILSFGLLLITAVRGLVFDQASWDLLALVIIGGGVATMYQGTQQTLPRRWMLTALGVGLIAAVVAVAISLLS